MSETSGRCRRTIDAMDAGACVAGMRCDHIIADAIDRLAADVAAIKEAVCDGSVAAERDRFLAGMAAALRERGEARKERDEAIRERDLAIEHVKQAICHRDEARAEVETAREQRGIAVMQRDAAITRRDDAEAEVERLKAKLEQQPPAAPPPAAPQPGWLTKRERELLSLVAGMAYSSECPPNPYPRLPLLPGDWTYREVHSVAESILSRAGSPPVVEVPVMAVWDTPASFEARAYRAAMDRAGVAWKEVGRE